MSHLICHHEGKYNIFSMVIDVFLFETPLSREEVEAWIKERYGQEGLDELPKRLERAHYSGTSSWVFDDLEDLLCGYTEGEGEDETHFSIQECLEKFFGAKGESNG